MDALILHTKLQEREKAMIEACEYIIKTSQEFAMTVIEKQQIMDALDDEPSDDLLWATVDVRIYTTLNDTFTAMLRRIKELLNYTIIKSRDPPALAPIILQAQLHNHEKVIIQSCTAILQLIQFHKRVNSTQTKKLNKVDNEVDDPDMFWQRVKVITSDKLIKELVKTSDKFNRILGYKKK